MLALFSDREWPQENVTIPPKFDWVKKNIRGQLLSVKQYYASRVFSLQSQNLLNRILLTGMAPLSYPLEKFLDIVNARADFIARNFRLTSEYSIGQPHKRAFYGSACTEYVLAVNSYISPFSTRAEVYETPAVKVLAHPCNVLSMFPPNGSDYGSMNGLVIVQIDIAKLLVQYRRFALTRMARNEQGEDLNVSTARFITTHVMPDMLESHLECAWFNKLMARYYGDAPTENVLKPVLAVADYGPHLDTLADIVVSRLKNSRRSYANVLQNLPALFNKSMLEVLRLPDLSPTIQVWWLILLSRMKIVRFLLDVGGEYGVRFNKGLINKFQIELSRLLRSGIPDGAMPADLEMEFRIDARYICSDLYSGIKPVNVPAKA